MTLQYLDDRRTWELETGSVSALTLMHVDFIAQMDGVDHQTVLHRLIGLAIEAQRAFASGGVVLDGLGTDIDVEPFVARKVPVTPGPKVRISLDDLEAAFVKDLIDQTRAGDAEFVEASIVEWAVEVGERMMAAFANDLGVDLLVDGEWEKLEPPAFKTNDTGIDSLGL